MDTIRRRLGNRFVLRDALVPQSVQPGGTLELQLSLTNEGYSAMYNARPVYVVLEKGSTRYTHLIDSVDPRRWEPGQEYTFSTSMPLPPAMEVGTYKLGLWLPDQASTLQNRPEYAVRFANTNVWDAATGLNILTSDIQVE